MLKMLQEKIDALKGEYLTGAITLKLYLIRISIYGHLFSAIEVAKCLMK